LHNLPAFSEKLRAIVGACHFVLRRMCQLAVNYFVTIPRALFDRAHGQRAESMPCHAAFVGDTTKGNQQGVVADRLLMIALVREQMSAAASNRVQLAQKVQGLAR
jgi:hypothetical protein